MAMTSIDTLKDQLARVIDGEVRFDTSTRALYATDASNYRLVPVGVVIPRHEEDVVRAVALARENRIPILPRGGGTALAGQTTNTALVLDFSKYMNSIRRVDPDKRVAVVEPGAVQAQLNAAAAKYGLFFAPDPATKDRCTLGGMIGNNSCGAHSAAHGKTVDNLVGLDVLLYDGTRLTLGGGDEGEYAAAVKNGGRVAELYTKMRELAERHGELVRARYPKIPRRVSGYNLDQLLPENGFNLARAIVGSEGTLAVVLGATVRLVPIPRKIALVVMGFDDVFGAADQTPWLLEHHPQALEGFDHRLPDFAREKGMPGVRYLPRGRAFLIAELGAETDDNLRAAARAVMREAERVAACTGVAILDESSAQRAVWSIRESGLGAGALLPGQRRTWPGAEDCAVPPARLGDFLRRLVPLLARYELEAATFYGHFGEGCVHCRINFDFFTAAGITKFRAAMTDIGELVVEFGGSLSGEHGDGRARSELLPKMYGRELLGAFRDFKAAFDPERMMNPGILADPEPLDAHLRIGANYRPQLLRTRFDFSAEGGLAGAALKCVGIGKCRKTDAGVMCPSYMATREEAYSTRGRAHLIYEALTSDLLPDGFADTALYEALELCLSCKACKSECPASVDMAAYKAEFLANFYKSHRRPLPVEFFGRIHEIARAASLAPALVNALQQGSTGSIVRRLLRLHPERTLPKFARQSFRRWFADRPQRINNAQQVLLFPDTFTNFFESEVAIAATEVLEHAGFQVILPSKDLCCGRPLYEAGKLDAGRWRLLEIVKGLSPFVERGISIVGLEPSCLLTLRDELPALFPRVSAARKLAHNAMLLDEFLIAKAPLFSPPPLKGTALVHGHCHQKALAGMDSELALLNKAKGLRVEAPDAGCCGMAGAFGYDARRFEVSRTIAERVLVPAVNESAEETLIIADGFACRSQIRQFCKGRHPMHLAQALNLKPAPAEEGAA
ncbi:MAG: FAD-binding protein [Deltaproteobacteria bacterium]|nr:FAD-binding protein [Deltaproteobacteria bacterium]